MKVGILGCGRLGSQLAHCLLTYGGVRPKDLKVSTRRPETLGTFFTSNTSLIKQNNCKKFNSL